MARLTDEQVEQAKRTDLVRYLESGGETLKRAGQEYRWLYRDGSGVHDSVTVRGSEWFDHKRQIGGDAIGFLQEFRGLDFRSAVAELIGGTITAREFYNDTPRSRPEERPVFTLPPKAPNMRRLYAYLCKSRGIPHEIVTHFVRAGTLYEDATHHNVVFLATDERGKPLGGMKKSTLSGSHFRQTVAGSDTRYGFHHKGSSGRLYVFEAAVDLLSFLALNREDWQAHSYLALDGVSSKLLHHFLRTYPDTSAVCLCLDNDSAGVQAAQRIAAELQEGTLEVSMLLPERKDWNEQLAAQVHELAQHQPKLCIM